MTRVTDGCFAGVSAFVAADRGEAGGHALERLALHLAVPIVLPALPSTGDDARVPILLVLIFGAGDEIRTHDPNLGKVDRRRRMLRIVRYFNAL